MAWKVSNLRKMISVGGDDGDGGVCPDPDNMTLDFNHPVYTSTTRQFML